MIRPEDFGADPTGVADSTAAFNDAFAYLRAAVDTTILGNNNVIDGSGATFKIAGSVDATGIVLGRNWGVKNLMVHATGSNKVTLDFTGSRFGHLSDIHIWGDETTPPRTGIQFSIWDDGESVQPCSHFFVENLSVDGFFRLAALHNYGGEEHTYENCRLWNRRVGDQYGESWAAILEGDSYKGTTSEFRTIPSGRRSFTVHRYTRCSFQKPFGIAGPTLFLQDIANHTFATCYVTNGDGAAIVWRLTDYHPYAVSMDFQVETTGVDTFIEFLAPGTIDDLDIKMGNVFAGLQLFRTPNPLQLNTFRLRVPRWQGDTAPANGVFNSKAQVSIFNGDIVVPAFNDFGDALTYAAFSGSVAGVGATVRHYGEHYLRSGQISLSDGAIQSLAGATLADDTATTISIPGGNDAGIFMLWSEQQYVAALVAFRADASPVVLMSQAGSVVNVVAGATLNGTAGADGKVTVSVRNGQIQVENRRGFSVVAHWQFISR